jgi:protein-L-isoaspartate(D-aspartate) O-methyltransferase
VGSDLLEADSPASVVEALEVTARHHFVPPFRQMVAYLDRDLPIGRGRRCPRPSVVARLLGAVGTGTGQWLVVGAGTGYVAACAAAMGGQVIAVEADPTLAGECAFALGRIANPERISMRQAVPTATDASYDAIVVCGSLERSPRGLLKKLAKDGVLVFPLRSNGEVRLFSYRNVPRGHVRRDLGELLLEPLGEEVVEC